MPGFEQGFTRLREALDAKALDAEELKPSARARYNIELVFEEIVGNILRYGAPPGRELHIEAQIHRDGESVVMTFEDDGMAFDPCSSSAAPARTLEEDRDGGFGLTIVRHAASAMRYERCADQRNRLTVILQASA